MTRFLLLRVAGLVPTLLIASIAVWFLIYLLPGDPAAALLGPEATPTQVADERARMGLDQPLMVQYVRWLGHAVTGDLGDSFVNNRPVVSLIPDRLAASTQLAAASFVLALVIGAPLGMLGATRAHRPVGQVVSTYASLALAVPSFWLGILLILTFGVQLHWLPTTADYIVFWQDPLGALRATALPTIALAVYVGGIIARFVRASMLQALRADYVRTARGKGVPEVQVHVSHALRNALLPTITIIGLQFGAYIGGAVVTESVFNYPGLGRLILSSVLQRDYTVLQASVLLLVLAFALINLVIDVSYALLDPRIRLGCTWNAPAGANGYSRASRPARSWPVEVRCWLPAARLHRLLRRPLQPRHLPQRQRLRRRHRPPDRRHGRAEPCAWLCRTTPPHSIRMPRLARTTPSCGR